MFQRKKLPLNRINPGPHARDGMTGKTNTQILNNVPVKKGNSIPKAKGKISVIAPVKASHAIKGKPANNPHAHKGITGAIMHPKKVGGSGSVLKKIAPSREKPIKILKQANNPTPNINRQIARGRSNKVGQL